MCDIWVARDGDGKLWLSYEEPTWVKVQSRWAYKLQHSSLPRSDMPDICPGECRKFSWDGYGPPYDSEFGDETICKCGHPYYRHFDPFDGNQHVGCKYCDCSIFQA